MSDIMKCPKHDIKLAINKNAPANCQGFYCKKCAKNKIWFLLTKDLNTNILIITLASKQPITTENLHFEDALSFCINLDRWITGKSIWQDFCDIHQDNIIGYFHKNQLHKLMTQFYKDRSREVL